MNSRSTFLSLLTCLIIGLQLVACTNTPSNYYLDSTHGDDNNVGTSESEAWKTLSRLDKLQLHPADSVLLKCGEQFNGTVNITAHGTQSKPIVIGSYGNSARRPVISAPDSSLYAVRIFNSDHVTLQDLEIVNHGSTPLPRRTGVKVEASNYGTSRGIRLHNLYIHDVNGSLVKRAGGGSGILIANGGDKEISVFDGLTIEYCHIQRCQRNAMIWSAYSDRSNWHPNRNVLVRFNLIEEVPGDGIVPIGCDGALIEYNVMRHCTALLANNGVEAAAGIWPWACDNTLIRFNESAHHKAPWDGQGFDADYNCRNTIIEYNYSHDNYGGMVLVCSSGDEDQTSYCIGTENPIVRYNISIGDGIRPYPTRGKMFSPLIHIGGPVRGCHIYRNILHNPTKPYPHTDRSMLVSDDWSGYASNTLIQENIFYSAQPSSFNMTASTGNIFTGNFYVGKYSPQPNDFQTDTLAPEDRETVSRTGPDGLLQFMDSITIAKGAKCIFVNKKNIEQFFNKLTKR